MNVRLFYTLIVCYGIECKVLHLSYNRLQSGLHSILLVLLVFSTSVDKLYTTKLRTRKKDIAQILFFVGIFLKLYSNIVPSQFSAQMKYFIG